MSLIRDPHVSRRLVTACAVALMARHAADNDIIAYSATPPGAHTKQTADGDVPSSPHKLPPSLLPATHAASAAPAASVLAAGCSLEGVGPCDLEAQVGAEG